MSESMEPISTHLRNRMADQESPELVGEPEALAAAQEARALGVSPGINIAPGSDDDGWEVPPPVILEDGTRLQLYKDGEGLAWAGSIGGLLPFIFAVALAGNGAYAKQWPLLFAYIGLLDAALIFVGLRRAQPALVIAAAFATGLTLPMWATQGLSMETLAAPALGAAFLTAILNLPPRLARMDWSEAAPGTVLEIAGVVAAGGLGT